MSTSHEQWHKAETDSLWHVWAVGDHPSDAPPICKAEVTVSDAPFDAAVTLDDMCPTCRGYHLAASPSTYLETL